MGFRVAPGKFAIAFDEGKLIGVMEGAGGITEYIPELIEAFGKNTRSRVIFHSDPESLVSISLRHLCKGTISTTFLFLR